VGRLELAERLERRDRERQCPPLPSASVKTSQVLSAQARTCQ
jgi:hypothetical protein